MCKFIANRSVVLFVLLFILLNSFCFYTFAMDSIINSQFSSPKDSLPRNDAPSLIEETGLQNTNNKDNLLDNCIILLVIIIISILCGLIYIYKKYCLLKNTLQKAQQNLLIFEQSSEIKTNYIASFSHEIRTPISGILGMSELLLNTPLNKIQRKHVKLIRRAGKHLSCLINSALDLARIEQNRLVINSEVFDLLKMLDDVIGLMLPNVEDKDLIFKQNITLPKSVFVEGDHVRLKQILFNLLSNSFKFTQRGEVILTVYERSEGHYFFSVSDTGIGIPTELQSRIFNRFEQAENSCAENSAKYGVGLGLSICKELIVAMEGEIMLSSIINKGTEISFNIPLLKRTNISDQHEKTSEQSGLSILLVEDSISIRELILELLTSAGHHVKYASHGLNALFLLKQNHFDFALINLDLPIMNGFILAEKIHADYLLPLIAITSSINDTQTRKQAEAAGFSKLLELPIQNNELMQLISDINGNTKYITKT